MNLYGNITSNVEINKLIEDEQEAIDGYNKALEVFKSKYDEETFGEIAKVINHIIAEEHEHIEELIELQENMSGKKDEEE